MKEHLVYWLEALNVSYVYFLTMVDDNVKVNDKDGDENNDNRNAVVGSRIADTYKITRSIIVNTLRKLESAGLISSRSMGKSGTYIKVLNLMIIKALEDYYKKQAFINSHRY